MFLVFKKRHIGIALIAIILVCALSVGTATALTSVSAKVKRKIPIYCVESSEKVIALTFDAAWGADKTKEIVDILDKYNAKATFFLVGFWIDKYPEETKYLVEHGIEIGNHSDSHPDLTQKGKNVVEREIISVNDRIEKFTNQKVRFFRAPFGAYNNQLMEVLEDLNMQGIQWDVDTLDWKGISGNDIANKVINKAKNGSIVLQHNNSDHILEALPIYLEEMTRQGYKFVTLSELVLKDNYKIDSSGKQISLG